MRLFANAALLSALFGFGAAAHGQFGGGFAPPRAPDPSPAATPPTPSPAPGEPTPPAPNAKEADPPVDAPIDPPQAKELPPTRVVCTPPDARWIAKLDPADREAIEAGLGYSLAAIGSDVKWVGATVKDGAPTLTGKVVVIQSFDVASGGTNAVDKVVAALGPAALDGNVIVVGVQVPNKVEAATKRLEQSKCKANLCIDTTGVFCDAVGAFKKPVNLVVDRNGAVRYAGLTEKGTALAAKVLLAEPNAKVTVAQKPAAAEAPTDPAAFPTFTEPVGAAADLRGKTSPDLLVDRWITKEPNMRGKLVLVDFFATWCPPCMAARSHMNEIARAYPKDLVIVGLSSETHNKFTDGLKKLKLKENDFAYSIALDPASRMQTAFGVQGIPSIAIVSCDQIVRWQGSPGGVTPALLDTLIAANSKLAGSNSSAAQSRGWVKPPSAK